VPRPPNLPGDFGKLAKKMSRPDGSGGVTAIAEWCDVVPYTVWRWANGQLPSGSARKLLTDLFSRNGLRAPNWATWGRKELRAMRQETKPESKPASATKKKSRLAEPESAVAA
jgi:hypothetical protein